MQRLVHAWLCSVKAYPHWRRIDGRIEQTNQWIRPQIEPMHCSLQGCSHLNYSLSPNSFRNKKSGFHGRIHTKFIWEFVDELIRLWCGWALRREYCRELQSKVSLTSANANEIRLRFCFLQIGKQDFSQQPKKKKKKETSFWNCSQFSVFSNAKFRALSWKDIHIPRIFSGSRPVFWYRSVQINTHVFVSVVACWFLPISNH